VGFAHLEFARLEFARLEFARPEFAQYETCKLSDGDVAVDLGFDSARL
jgi:hypothetical protein